MEVTEAAVAVIETMREQVGAPQEAALRIQRTDSPEGPVLGLAFTDGPQEGDAKVEQSGVVVALEPGLESTLSEAVLDAQSTPEGEQLIVRA